ncbi:hypothetical protein [Microvirga zambiensis]|uniref:sunset domain-containing protein n=1 Tax=Microvirga zambiensis TaxID=1402137 RepID=UPI003CCCD563
MKGRPSNNQRKRARSWVPVILGGFFLAGVISVGLGPQLSGCTIKGNISVNTGERIYHVLGQEFYSETRIDLLKGERWFCSEDEARKAGWRKSRV